MKILWNVWINIVLQECLVWNIHVHIRKCDSHFTSILSSSISCNPKPQNTPKLSRGVINPSREQMGYIHSSPSTDLMKQHYTAKFEHSMLSSIFLWCRIPRQYSVKLLKQRLISPFLSLSKHFHLARIIRTSSRGEVWLAASPY